MQRHFGSLAFEFIGSIEPEQDNEGYLDFMPQPRYRKAAEAKLHTYGSGPFCRFRIARGRREPGLYVLTRDEAPVYAGECANLQARWGPNGYGGISPRNCFHGGQPTNCRINSAILTSVKEGRKIQLWFAKLDANTEMRRVTETELIQSLKPIWNRAKVK